MEQSLLDKLGRDSFAGSAPGSKAVQDKESILSFKRLLEIKLPMCSEYAVSEYFLYKGLHVRTYDVRLRTPSFCSLITTAFRRKNRVDRKSQ